MNKSLSRFACIPLVIGAAVAAFAVLPLPDARAGDDDQAEARALLQRGEILPLQRILQLVQEQVPGDVIEIDLDRSDKHGWEYEVKVLAASGRVLEVDVDAHNGAIRKIEDD